MKIIAFSAPCSEYSRDVIKKLLFYNLIFDYLVGVPGMGPRRHLFHPRLCDVTWFVHVKYS